MASAEGRVDGKEASKIEHRVISLLPAAAETLHAAGGIGLLVARGHEDDFPADITRHPIVTSAKIHFTTSAEVDAAVVANVQAQANGTVDEDDEGMYSLNKDLIRNLRPTVILTQGLCSVCAVSQPMVKKIADGLDPVPEIVSLSPVSLEDIIDDVIKVGKAVGLETPAAAAAAELHQRVDRVKKIVKEIEAAKGPEGGAARPSILFMEWTEPIYVGGHWTPQVIHLAGCTHPLNPPLVEGGPAGPSIIRTTEEAAASDPDWVIVCPCGLDIPTTRKELKNITGQPWWQGLRAVKGGKVALVDGHQMFNRSGPRIVDALEFLVGLIHGVKGLIPQDFPWELLNDQ